jgi:hypothetical protein
MTLNHLKGYKIMLDLTIDQCVALEREAFMEGDTLKADLYDTIARLLMQIETLETELEEQKDETANAQELLLFIRDTMNKKGY